MRRGSCGSQPENRGKLALFAGIDGVRFTRITRLGDVLDLVCDVEVVRRPVVMRAGARVGRRRSFAVRGTLTPAVGLGSRAQQAHPISITGLGCHALERVVTNEELAQLADTTDEWIRRAPDQGAADRMRRRGDVRPGASGPSRQALEQAGVRGQDLDLIIVATVTPDMTFLSIPGARRRRARQRRCRSL